MGVNHCLLVHARAFQFVQFLTVSVLTWSQLRVLHVLFIEFLCKTAVGALALLCVWSVCEIGCEVQQHISDTDLKIFACGGGCVFVW